MLKIRLMGTKNDITWFKKIMQRHPKVEVLEMSDLYPNKGMGIGCHTGHQCCHKQTAECHAEGK